MWFVLWLVGLITGAAVVRLYSLVKEKKLQVKWFHLVIGVLWYLMGVFGIGFIGTSIAEGEPQAAGMAVLIFGGTFLVASVLLYRFVFAKQCCKLSEKKEVTA